MEFLTFIFKKEIFNLAFNFNIKNDLHLISLLKYIKLDQWKSQST